MLARAKTLALIAVSLLASGAIGATAAQAVEFHTEGGKEETTITGAALAGPPLSGFTIKTNSPGSYCHLEGGTSYDGTMSGATASALTITPTFGECFAPPTMGGCDFVLHASGAFDIGGGAGCGEDPIEFSPGCLTKIGPQEGLTSVSYVNEGEGSERDIEATIKVTDIHYIQNGFLCKPSGTFNNGEITFIATLQAEDSEGNQKGLWVE